MSLTSWISLSLIFFLSRDTNIEMGFYRNLGILFVLHNIILGGILIKEQYDSVGLSSMFGKVSVIEAIFCFAWALIGIMKLASQQTRN